ncbi:MAG: MerR family transcriptional regulator [Slackia sp.]|nr:MerR family transcriptional regulator [Slackia sp.]
MPYTVKELAQLSGVSVRTLHYYEEVGLLAPRRRANGYREFDADDVARLQQVLLYRDAGMALADIKALLDDESFDMRAALREHLDRLAMRIERTEAMMRTVERTLAALEKGTEMDDKKRFEGMKRLAVEENERRYGAEVRAAYGDDAVDAANEKVLAMDEVQWESAEELGAAILDKLAEAAQAGDACGPAARELCAMHETWLKMYWPDGMYTREAHAALAEGYVADERFRAYYDARIEGGAQFLRDALKAYCAC